MKKWVWLSLYAISMAYLEASVVVYLRLHYYPVLTRIFPLAPMEPKIYLIELGRELSTLIMLLSVAFVAASKKRQILFDFLFIFGLWDVFYYIWLKLLINWPGSLKTWDVLFLIPIPWFAPWITPFIVASIFVIAGFYFDKKLETMYPKSIVQPVIWALLGSLLIFLSFIYVPLKLLLKGGVRALQSFLPPAPYPWILYLAGVIVLIYAGYSFNKNLIKEV